MTEETKPLKIAALGDLHVKDDQLARPIASCSARSRARPTCWSLTGDLTDLGRPREAEILAEDLRACSIPVVAVLGNHDYECGHVDEVKAIIKRRRRPPPRRLVVRDRRRRLRRRQGLCRRLRPAHARLVRRGGHQDLRGRDHERGDAARERHARRASHARRGGPALRADRRDGRGRAAGDLPVPRLLAPRRDHRPLQGAAPSCTATPIAAQYEGRTPAGAPVYNVAYHIEKPTGRPYALIEV